MPPLGTPVIRDAKGQKDRLSVMPKKLVNTLQAHLIKVKNLHEQDLSAGFGQVNLPFALERKYPDLDTTMIYTHVMQQGNLGVKSPLDR
ncbi:hypothetical protein JXO59_16345 [candidate division KSB1 bacterium]|nr:hypothetical protein [candidate division KSB1 bacterium]